MSDGRMGFRSASYEVARMVPGKGIFVAQFTPRDKAGRPISNRTYNWFVAPENLGALMLYADTAREMGNLRGWYGRDGVALDPDQYEEQLHTGLRDRTALDKWVMLPLEIVSGVDRSENLVLPVTNLRELELREAIKGVFAREGEYRPGQWSCTNHI